MNTQAQFSFPVAGLLGCIFVTLKLTGYIAWSWLWVLAPFWGPLALVILFLIGIGLFWLTVLVVTAAALFFRKRK